MNVKYMTNEFFFFSKIWLIALLIFAGITDITLSEEKADTVADCLAIDGTWSKERFCGWTETAKPSAI